MKVKAAVLREVLRVPQRETSRYVVAGIHLRDNIIEATDTRMLVRVPCEPETAGETFPGVTFSRPFGLPAATGDKKSGWFGKLRLLAGKASLLISNKDKQRTEVDALEGQWPKSEEILKGCTPAFSINISPFRLGKLMAIFRAGAVKEDDCAVRITVYKNSTGGTDTAPVGFKQSGSEIEAYLMQTRDWREESK